MDACYVTSDLAKVARFVVITFEHDGSEVCWKWF